MNLAPPAVLPLWPTLLSVSRYNNTQTAEMNDTLARVFRAMRASDSQADPAAAFYASSDDLMARVQLPEFTFLFAFIAEALQQTVKAANANVWPPRISLKLEIVGAWFQIQNQGAFHDIHSHGNCSWSGVYYVQIDASEQRRQHAAFGELNGLTRFYGLYQNLLGGAYMDMGNAYLQHPHYDVVPEPGMLILFPSFLNHKAMPYEGEQDRIVVSFNAQIHGADGDQLSPYAAG
ncbi:MAG: hypothetical protein CVU17_10790 [Betaproteobacteria bacterium HGW-Betaproteobacteria-11]|nr:MAG: hypothetical protein CVU17_10790 [Betaproteobacteria bacterium HGW-Betaproteobacteria-11]